MHSFLFLPLLFPLPGWFSARVPHSQPLPVKKGNENGCDERNENIHFFEKKKRTWNMGIQQWKKNKTEKKMKIILDGFSLSHTLFTNQTHKHTTQTLMKCSRSISASGLPVLYTSLMSSTTRDGCGTSVCVCVCVCEVCVCVCGTEKKGWA